jgi:hypothetical protein
MDNRYKVEGYGGIAWYTLGPVKVRDEDYEWSGLEYDHESLVRMVMVGDDRVFEIDRDDLTPISDEDYCHECGQIGCTADGRG